MHIYKNGSLYIEDVRLADIVNKFSTPAYCYSKQAICNNYLEIEKSLQKYLPGTKFLIAYAVKACSNIAILKLLQELGAGADIVSEGELLRAKAANIDTSKIVFSGVGKTDTEIKRAIETDIGQINVESVPELLNIAKIAQELEKTAKIALRINPDIDADTHEKIATGRKGDKFGIDIDEAIDVYKLANDLDGIKIVGIAIHIGSQISKTEPFKKAFKKIATLVKDLRNIGINIENIDIGGGFGITYDTEKPMSFTSLAKILKEIITPLDCKIILEPGRFIIGNAGVLLSKVLYVKETKHKNFLIIDAAMNDLARPSIYGAYHPIIPLVKDKNEVSYEVVGPVCETGDIFCKEEKLPKLKQGDLLAIMVSGAYGSSMSSNYNSRPLLPEILITGDKYKLIRKKQELEDLFLLENYV